MRPGLRFKVLTRDNYTCRYCGAKAPDVKLHVDHVVPRAAGGTNDLRNLITACQPCNQGKAAMLTEQAGADLTEEEYKAKIGELLDAASNWLWHDLAKVENDWEDFSRRRPTRRETMILGEMILVYGEKNTSKAMEMIASRLGWTGDECDCPRARDGKWHERSCPIERVQLDLFEMRQTLSRWRSDGFA